MTPNFAGFLSYAHNDDEYHNGAISALREKLSLAVRSKTGKTFPILQDHNDIDWGQPRPNVLDRTLTNVRFLIPVISPSFFKSEWCPKELKRFLEVEAEQSRDDLIFPIYWETCPLIENTHERERNRLAAKIAERQRVDWRPLHHMPIDGHEVMTIIDRMGVSMKKALERPEIGDQNDGVGKLLPTGEEYPTDILEISVHEHRDDYDAGPLIQRRKQGDNHRTVQRAKPGFFQEEQARCLAETKVDVPKPGNVFWDIREPWLPEMVWIRAGTFRMGSSSSEAERFKHEGPQHRVTIGKPFALGRYPVTFEEYDHFTDVTGREKADDNGWGRGTRPVINVDVEDAEAYLAWLSEVTGQIYCLPSEAEWEYACRAQTTTPFWTGQDITTDQANYNGNYPYTDCEKGAFRGQTTAVGSFTPNPFGLYDMTGNVWEWCTDSWHEDYLGAPIDGSAWSEGGDPAKRVLRGGSWFGFARGLRSARRDPATPDYRHDDVGFRCASVIA